MNYNYPQQQYQVPIPAGYRAPSAQAQYPSWNQAVGVPSPQVRPVSSIEEVRACPIDFDGSVFYFADMANKRIYTKQINIDGTASINLYELKEFPIQPSADLTSTTSYVTKEEFEATIKQMKEMYDKLLINSMPVVNNNPIVKEEVDQMSAAQPTQKIPQFSF